MYNGLPRPLKEISALGKFKKTLFEILVTHSFYSIDEFMEYIENSV